MRWARIFNRRATDNEHKRSDRSVTGNAGPDFSCVGPQKTGTGWLYQQLEPHPDFWMPPIKELHYFDQLSRPPLANPPRPRDERDLCFLQSLTTLSAVPYIDLEIYARLSEPKGSLRSGEFTPGCSTP